MRPSRIAPDGPGRAAMHLYPTTPRSAPGATRPTAPGRGSSSHRGGGSGRRGVPGSAGWAPSRGGGRPARPPRIPAAGGVLAGREAVVREGAGPEQPDRHGGQRRAGQEGAARDQLRAAGPRALAQGGVDGRVAGVLTRPSLIGGRGQGRADEAARPGNVAPRRRRRGCLGGRGRVVQSGAARCRRRLGGATVTPGGRRGSPRARLAAGHGRPRWPAPTRPGPWRPDAEELWYNLAGPVAQR